MFRAKILPWPWNDNTNAVGNETTIVALFTYLKKYFKDILPLLTTLQIFCGCKANINCSCSILGNVGHLWMLIKHLFSKKKILSRRETFYLGIDKYTPTIPTERELQHIRAATNNSQHYLYRLLLGDKYFNPIVEKEKKKPLQFTYLGFWCASLCLEYTSMTSVPPTPILQGAAI